MFLHPLVRKLADPIAISVLADAAGWHEGSNRAERRALRTRAQVLQSYARRLTAR